ncbi:hypothetical protein [Arthrobacter sp. A5]|uniref:hypothetical protein n=1 Tax=Arthrobacter sp. A5 TaxID=576926 RepID=UPI003DA85B69
MNLSAELAVCTAVVARMRQPLWQWRLTIVHSSLLHLEGRFDEARARSDEALQFAAASGDASAAWMHLVISSAIALHTGVGLDRAEASVRTVLEDAA